VSHTFDFGELRSLLQQAPSRQVWAALCALVDSPAWDEAAEQWLPYAAEIMERGWPDALREWPELWWFRLHQPRGVALVRAFMPINMTTRQMERLGETIPGHAVQLREVRLRLDGHTPEAPITALAHALRPTLRALELDASTANARLLRALLSTRCASLEHLRAQSGLEDGAVLAAIFGGVSVPRLTALSMDSNRVQLALLCAALERTPLAGRLRALRMDGVQMGDAGASAMATQRWEALERLSMNKVELTATGLGALLAQTPALRALHVQENPLGADPTVWFARAPALRLEELDVRRTAHLPGSQRSWSDVPWVAPSGAQLPALLELEQVSALRTLSLREGRLEASAVRRLIARFAGQLERLDLSYVSAPALWELLQGTRWPRLRALTVHGAHPPNAACEALASMDMPALTSLDLQSIALTRHGAALLEGAPWRAQLPVLFLPTPQE
jgi:hypothetical protein